MNGPDRYVSMALDDVIKYRRKEGGRGGFRRGGRGGRGGQNVPMQRGRGGGMRGGRGGFPRSPGGRVVKNRIQNQQVPHQPNFRGGRGFQRGGGQFIQRGRGRGMHMQQQPQMQFNPRVGITTGHNQNMRGRMRAWAPEPPMEQPMHAPMPMRGRGRGRGRGGMRGAMRGPPAPPLQNRAFRMRPAQQHQHAEEMFDYPPMQQYPPQQPPKHAQSNAAAKLVQQLSDTAETARSRVRLAQQVLMQRKRALTQLNQQKAEIEGQLGLKSPRGRGGLRGRGVTTQRVTGLRRGGGVLKRAPVDARTAIKQKILRSSVNRARALQRAQNAPMHPGGMVPPPPMPPRGRMPRPMPARGMAAAAIRRAANFRRNQAGRQMGRQLTLHERFSNQSWE